MEMEEIEQDLRDPFVILQMKTEVQRDEACIR